MSLADLLPEFLQRTDDPPVDDAALHECRHCGSKFERRVDRCPICGATEIATYEFGTDDIDRR